jgi:hypothetical protein
MNLHAIVRGAITAINPDTPAMAMISDGYVTMPGGMRRPTFQTARVVGQVQALSYLDLTLIDGLNINGERRAIYLNGRLDGVRRPLGAGGDLLAFKGFGFWPFGSYWKVAQNAEQWPDWCKVICTLQVGGPTFITAHGAAGVLHVGAVETGAVKHGALLLGQNAAPGSAVGEQIDGEPGGVGSYVFGPVQDLDHGDYLLFELA